MTTTAAPAEPITIAATDGYPLAATLFASAASPRRVVLISPATGVKRRLYGAFAAYLASRGSAVLTWDWRGTGDSRPARMRGFRATMTEWARLDLAGMIGWAAERVPGAKLAAVGHSFGGQGIGLAPNAGRLDAIVTVAAQSGWWGHWPRGQRWKYALLWHAVMPAMTHAIGYFPFRRLGVGEDLPKGVALEWARWCRTRDYLGDWRGHAAVRAPLLALGFGDDPFAPREAVEALVARYGSDRKVHRHVSSRPGRSGWRPSGTSASSAKPSDRGCGRRWPTGWSAPERHPPNVSMSDRFATTPPSHGDDEPRRTGEEPRASNLDDLSPWSGRRSQGSGGPEWKDLDLRSRAKLLSTALGWGVTAARYLWAAGGIRSLINWTVMRHGWLEVRARGPGIDTTGRAEAHYAYSGFLNSSSSGWSIHFGRGPDDPRGGESSGPQPNPWCEVMLQTEWPLEAGVTYRTDGTDARTRLVSGAVLGVPEPYSSFAAPGVMQVDEASRGTVRGRFHLTLPRRVNQGSGPPVVVEGTFEIRRKRPRPG